MIALRDGRDGRNGEFCCTILWLVKLSDVKLSDVALIRCSRVCPKFERSWLSMEMDEDLEGLTVAWDPSFVKVKLMQGGGMIERIQAKG